MTQPWSVEFSRCITVLTSCHHTDVESSSLYPSDRLGPMTTWWSADRLPGRLRGCPWRRRHGLTLPGSVTRAWPWRSQVLDVGAGTAPCKPIIRSLGYAYTAQARDGFQLKQNDRKIKLKGMAEDNMAHLACSCCSEEVLDIFGSPYGIAPPHHYGLAPCTLVDPFLAPPRLQDAKEYVGTEAIAGSVFLQRCCRKSPKNSQDTKRT